MLRVAGRESERLADVAIAEAPDDMVAAEHGAEECHVGLGSRIEASDLTAAVANRLRHTAKRAIRWGRIVDDCQGVEVALV
jgi:hypothetical protein